MSPPQPEPEPAPVPDRGARARTRHGRSRHARLLTPGPVTELGVPDSRTGDRFASPVEVRPSSSRRALLTVRGPHPSAMPPNSSDTLDITVSTHQTEDRADHRHARPRCVRSRAPPVTLVRRALGKSLVHTARRGMTASRPLARRSSRRFPTSRYAPDAPIIPATRIQRVLDEEGLF